MKRVVIWGWHKQSPVEAIKSLSNKGCIEIVAWFGESKACTHDLDGFLHQFDIEEYVFTGAAKGIYLDVYKDLPEFMSIYSRVSYSMGKTYQEILHIFNMYLDFLANLLISNQVELVLFSNLPHFGVDSLLYSVAKNLGIKTVMANQSLIPNRFFYVLDLDDFGNFNTTEKSSTALDITVERTHFKDLGYYMSKIPRVKKCCVASLLNDLLHLFVLKKKKPMTLTGAVQKFQICRAFNKRITRHSVNRVDMTHKFVYFPLQLQPELTTSAIGGIYEDQLLAIERLRQLIPDDWYIYAKENPKQTQRQRDDFFYRRLLAIDKTVYVASSVNTYELIENCQFVATITGTVGWEAISGGKCALIFGNAWYKTLPGVFAYANDLELSDVTGYTIDHDELQKAYNELVRRSAVGVVDPDYESLVDNYSEIKNAASLEEFVTRFL